MNEPPVSAEELRKLLADYRELKNREEPYYDLALTDKAWNRLAVSAVNSLEALLAERDALAERCERLEAAVKLAECQYMGCGGRLSPAEIVQAMRDILAQALTKKGTP